MTRCAARPESAQKRRSPAEPRLDLAQSGTSHVREGPDGDDFVDTGDMVELRGDRYHFVGRRGGIINIGGLKVRP